MATSGNNTLTALDVQNLTSFGQLTVEDITAISQLINKLPAEVFEGILNDLGLKLESRLQRLSNFKPRSYNVWRSSIN